MPGRQVRVDEAVVRTVHQRRRELGFPVDAADGTVISQLTREAIEARLEANRKRERSALYAEWARERDLLDAAGAEMRAAVRDGIA